MIAEHLDDRFIGYNHVVIRIRYYGYRISWW